MKMTVFFSILLLFGASLLDASEMILADGGRTAYAILLSDKADAGDRMAAQVLQKNLKLKTGADFSVISRRKAGGKYIVIGQAPSGQKRTLREDEYVLCSDKGNIHLYGEGMHGAFNATVDFMEDQLGWRWYNAREKPVIPPVKKLVLKNFRTVRRFVYPYRMRGSSEFFFYHGCNMMVEEWNIFCRERYGRYFFNPLIRSKKIWPLFVHVGYLYVPPYRRTAQELKGHYQQKFITCHEYAKTHPEFYAMKADGSRKPDIHLCWSNRNLRKLFLELLEKQLAVCGENAVISIDNGDDANCGVICHCPKCRKLSEKYRTLTGPSLDFALEVAEIYRTKHPDVLINTPVVRRNPAKNSFYEVADLGGRKLPDNILAGIYYKEFINRPAGHPSCRNFLESLKKVRQMSSRVYLWNYPHTYQLTGMLPFSNLKIHLRNFPVYRSLVYMKFDETNDKMVMNFNQMQTYVMLHMFKDPGRNPQNLIKDYIRGRYGKAAPLVLDYWNELEEACCNWKYGISYDYGGSLNMSTAFGYLTPRRLLHWEKMCDRMAALVRENEPQLRAVRTLRYPLDFAVLMTWRRTSAADRGYFADPKKFADRLLADAAELNPLGWINKRLERQVRDILSMLSMGDQIRPLPSRFRHVPEGDIIRGLPVNTLYARGRKISTPGMIRDRDAAFGFAYTVDRPDMPFQCGIYHFSTKSHGPRLNLEEDDIMPGGYHLYRLGETVLTQRSLFWTSAASWATNLELDQYWDSNNTMQKWVAFVSLKFPENYAGRETDIVLCDQIILVKKESLKAGERVRK